MIIGKLKDMLDLTVNKYVIDVYTDGACLGNPGPGGWAFSIEKKNKPYQVPDSSDPSFYMDRAAVNEDSKYQKSGWENNTTNNRMELTAAIKAFEYIEKNKFWVCNDSDPVFKYNKPIESPEDLKNKNKFQAKYSNLRVDIHSDSKYLITGITDWIYKWKENNWKTSGKKKVENLDLWQLLDQRTKKFIINWNWVKAHSGNIRNERVDLLAKDAAGIAKGETK